MSAVWLPKYPEYTQKEHSDEKIPKLPGYSLSHPMEFPWIHNKQKQYSQIIFIAAVRQELGLGRTVAIARSPMIHDRRTITPSVSKKLPSLHNYQVSQQNYQVSRCLWVRLVSRGHHWKSGNIRPSRRRVSTHTTVLGKVCNLYDVVEVNYNEDLRG